MKKISLLIISVSLVLFFIVSYYEVSEQSDEFISSSTGEIQKPIITGQIKSIQSVIPQIYTNTTSNTSVVQKALPNMNMPQLTWSSVSQKIEGKTYQYIFGMGNPPELVIGSDELRDIRKNIKDESGFGYVTPEAERALFRFLSNPSLGYVLSRCAIQIRIEGVPMESIIQIAYSYGYFNLDNTLYIDESGRKQIAIQRLPPIMERLDYIAYRLDPPLWRECLSESEYMYHLEGILRDYRSLWNTYYN